LAGSVFAELLSAVAPGVGGVTWAVAELGTPPKSPRERTNAGVGDCGWPEVLVGVAGPGVAAAAGVGIAGGVAVITEMVCNEEAVGGVRLADGTMVMDRVTGITAVGAGAAAVVVPVAAHPGAGVEEGSASEESPFSCSM
jgi:hypothetical protein